MKIRSRWLNGIAGLGLGKITRAWAATLRYEVHYEDPDYDPQSESCPHYGLYPTWHDTMLLPIMLRSTIRKVTPNNRMTTLVSLHQDGAFLTYGMRYFHLGTVRGSTNHGGARALRQLIDEARQQHICMTPDGPRGPRRIVSPGVITLAALSGTPILPTPFMAPRVWSISGSWTSLVAPKPASTVTGLIGAPIFVPPEGARDRQEEFRLRVQQRMDELQQKVDERAAKRISTPPVWSAEISRAA